RAGHHEATLASANRVPIRCGDSAMIGAGGDGDGGVVLLRSVDHVVEAIVGGYVIDRSSGLIILASPCAAAVVRDRGAAVVAVDHVRWVDGIDPQAVMVAMRRAQYGKGAAAIGRAVKRSVEDVDGIHGFGIGEDVVEVPGALRVRGAGVDARPGVAPVVGAINSALLRFHNGIDALRVTARNCYADAAQHAARK